MHALASIAQVECRFTLQIQIQIQTQSAYNRTPTLEPR